LLCLKAKGLEVEVVAPAFKGLRSHEIEGIKVHRYRYAPQNLEILTGEEGAPSKIARNPFLKLLAIPYIISGMLKIFMLCFKNRYDVLHVHWPFPHGIQAFPAAKIFKIPVVLNYHGASLLLIKKNPWVRPVLKFLTLRADRVFANSNFTAQRILEVCPTPVLISPYGCTFDPNPLGKAPVQKNSNSEFVLLFVGRHIERKGIVYLLEAMKLFNPQENIHLLIVGEGDLTLDLQSKVQQESIPNIQFLGRLNSEDLQATYARANVFLLPAIIDSKGDTEGLGVVLIEAIEKGLVVIASEVGGITDVIKHEQSGLLVPQKDPLAIADAVRRLRTDSTLYQSLITKAKRHVQSQFSWDRIIQEQISAYRTLISKKEQIKEL
jgi:glycosyltransferase involved in cell wall biosynthesis